MKKILFLSLALLSVQFTYSAHEHKPQYNTTMTLYTKIALEETEGLKYFFCKKKII